MKKPIAVSYFGSERPSVEIPNADVVLSGIAASNTLRSALRPNADVPSCVRWRAISPSSGASSISLCTNRFGAEAVAPDRGKRQPLELDGCLTQPVKLMLKCWLSVLGPKAKVARIELKGLGPGLLVPLSYGLWNFICRTAGPAVKHDVMDREHNHVVLRPNYDDGHEERPAGEVGLALDSRAILSASCNGEPAISGVMCFYRYCAAMITCTGTPFTDMIVCGVSWRTKKFPGWSRPSLLTRKSPLTWREGNVVCDGIDPQFVKKARVVWEGSGSQFMHLVLSSVAVYVLENLKAFRYP